MPILYRWTSHDPIARPPHKGHKRQALLSVQVIRKVAWTPATERMVKKTAARPVVFLGGGDRVDVLIVRGGMSEYCRVIDVIS